MKKKFLLLIGISSFSAIYAQVGVNTENPRTTLHVIPSKTDGSTAEGIIAPNLTRAQLILKDGKYTQTEKGAIIYVTDLSGTITTRTAKVTAAGYYYFDGSVWQPFNSGVTIPVTTANNGLTMIGTTTQLGGALTKATAITGSATNTLTLNAPTIIPATGTFTLSGNGAGGGKYLASDVNGKASWSALPTAAVTTASNGLTMSGTSVQLGGVLSKPTLIMGTSTNRLNLNVPTTISASATFTLEGNGVGAGRYLGCDIYGNATWRALPETAMTEPWMLQGTSTVATSNGQNIFHIGSVAIGSNTAESYDLKVSGTSYVTGNSVVGSSRVIGTESVGGTLEVGGVATMSNNLVVNGNTGMGIAAPTQKLHVVGNEYVTGISKVGGAVAMNASAQLELGDNNKGFLPNRVALTSALVKAPVTNAVDGMMIYNSANVPTEDLRPGYYYWKTNRWYRLVDEIPETSIKMFYQTTNTVGGAATGSDQSKMTSMRFSVVGSANIPVALALPEDGSYAFNVKLYSVICNTSTGLPKTPSYAGKAVAYVGIWINGVLQDVSEVFITLSPLASGSPALNGGNVTNVVLGCSGKFGDSIDIRLGYYGGSLSAGEGILSQGLIDTKPRSDRTSLVYWKL